MLIVLIIIVVLVVLIAGAYNGLVTSRNKVKNAWSQIDVQPNDGGTDLSNYYTKPEVNSLLANKQGTLSSGDAIEITNDTISVTVDDALSTDSENPVQNKVVTSSLSSKVSNLGGVSNMLALTENEYNALETKDSNTLYIIVDD